MSNKDNNTATAKPVWARPSWFFEHYGLSAYLLAKAAEDGHVRRAKPNEESGGGRSAAVLYAVADVDAWLEGRAKK